MGTSFYVRRGGRERGPFTPSELRGLIESRDLIQSDEVSADRSTWQPASRLKGATWPPEQAPSRNLSDIAAPFVLDEQDPAVVAKLLAHVRQICTATEDVRYIAVQRKPVLTLSPDAVVATTRRLLILRTGLLGKVEMRDFIWRDIADATIKEGIMAATFQVRLTNGAAEIVEYVPKKQARALYRIAQEMEEHVREERRVRAMEESRAAAGGVNVTLAAPVGTSNQPDSEDHAATLRKLKSMVGEGLLTQEEFERKKAEVLKRI